MQGTVAYAARQGYRLANVNNHRPTTLDGAWRVSSVTSAQVDTTLPDWIYFEYNRAFMVVFHLPNGKYETHDFSVDEPARNLAILETVADCWPRYLRWEMERPTEN